MINDASVRPIIFSVNCWIATVLALLIAFSQLPLPCRDLLLLLMQEPPVPYTEISKTLGIPVGGIGPSRARCLAKLRRCQPLADLLDEEDDEDGRGGGSGG